MVTQGNTGVEAREHSVACKSTGLKARSLELVEHQKMYTSLAGMDSKTGQCTGWLCVNLTQVVVITEKGALVEKMSP